MSFSRKRNWGTGPAEATDAHPVETGDLGEITDGDIKYVIEKAGNDSEISYQEASGAPVEVVSPLGYSVGSFTIILLNISKMIGTGIYSTRKLFIHTCCRHYAYHMIQLLPSSPALVRLD
jgi:hypothetical protein